MPGKWDDINTDIFHEIKQDRLVIHDKTDEDGIKKAVIHKISERAATQKYIAKHAERIRSFEDVTRFPKKNEIVRLITQAQFNTFTIVLSVLKNFGDIEQLYISTYNMKRDVIDAFFGMVRSGQIKKMTIIISQSFKHRMPDRYLQLRSEVEKTKNTRLKLVWNHSKIALMKTKKHYFILEGSGNLSDNAWIEQYTLSNSRQGFDFYRDFFEYLFERRQQNNEEEWLN